MTEEAFTAAALRSAMAQIHGAPLHYGLIAALCRVLAEFQRPIVIRHRSLSWRSADKRAEPIDADGVTVSLLSVLQRVTCRLDSLGGDEAGVDVDDWEIELLGESDIPPAVIQPHDPTLGGSWRVTTVGEWSSPQGIGREWARTCAELTEQLMKAPIVEVSRVLVGRRSTATETLTLIHGADGSVAPFAALAARLPFSTRAFRGMPSLIEGASDLRDLARHYADILCDIDDSNYYWIGGHSFGAVVAREMAAILEKRGKQLGIVISLDPALALAAWELGGDRYTELVTLIKAALPAEESARILSQGPDELALETELQHRLPSSRLKKILETRLRCLQLLKSYRSDEPLEFTPRVAYLHASEPLFPEWNPVVRRYRAQGLEVPGNHFSMLAEPHVARLASIVQSFCAG